jgi:YidC/Oxa1 family membrane protein insertase
MEKRLFLAIALALLVLVGWSTFVSKVYHIDNKEVASTIAVPATIQPVRAELNQVGTTEPPSYPTFNLSLKKYDIVFVESQAAIKEVIFKDYQNYSFPLKYGFLLGGADTGFKKTNITTEKADFVYRDANKEISKHFSFSDQDYSISLELDIKNLSNLPLSISLPVILGNLNLSGDQTEARLRDVTLADQDKITHRNPAKDITLEGIKFVGLRDRYFCAIIEPASGSYSGFVKKITSHEHEVGLVNKELNIAPGQETKLKFNIYLGPQELKRINDIKPEWSGVMYYGAFDFIAHLLLRLLDFLFNLVHNWGIAIILISIIIYFILYPLSLKQMRSMKQMQALQPRIEQLRKTYKDNPQKLNTEVMGLYREYKINPLSGCLPLILQIPVFFALYQVLIRSVALKGAKFLWIKDLAAPDRLFTLPMSIPVLGNEVNLLPILMTIGMFVQQKTSMASASTGSAEQQKLMLILFPLMFGVIFYHMPSGLVLYWFVNSALMLFFQLKMSRQK